MQYFKNTDIVLYRTYEGNYRRQKWKIHHSAWQES